MVVDYGRTCFTQLMQFDVAGDIIVPVRFYFAVPGAKDFPGEHLYGTDYFLFHTDCGVGPGLYWNDVRTYDKGAPPSGITGQGPPCGPLDWWVNGVPSSAPPLALDPQGRPICCRPQNQFQDTLGIAIGVENTVCQPWHVFGPPARTMRDLTAGVTWVQNTHTTNQQSFHDPAATTHITTYSAVGVNACLTFSRTVAQLAIPGHAVLALNLLSFDPPTHSALWQVPSTAAFYANHIFKFTNPT